MKMMGLKTWVYWLVTYIFSYLLYLIAMFLSIAIAAAMSTLTLFPRIRV